MATTARVIAVASALQRVPPCNSPMLERWHPCCGVMLHGVQGQRGPRSPGPPTAGSAASEAFRGLEQHGSLAWIATAGASQQPGQQGPQWRRLVARVASITPACCRWW